MNSNLEQYNKEHLRSLQLKMLGILEAIDDVCRKSNIDYWLDGGSCLGAVRHGGFIPWDDDIDIAMREEDVPRFIESAKKNLPEGLFLQTKETDSSCRALFVKVRDMNSFIVESGDDLSRPYQKGLFVDIFPMLAYPDIPRKLCKKITKGYCKCNAILHQQHVYSWKSVAELFWFGGKRIVYSAIWRMLNAFSKKKVWFGNRIVDNGYGIMHRQDSIFPVKPIEFEGKIFSGPANPDAYLKDLYNDYMKLPPEDKRKGHAVFFIDKLV